MTQEIITQSVKDAQTLASGAIAKTMLLEFCKDGGIVDQMVQLKLETAPTEADHIVAWGAETKKALQAVIAEL